MTNAKLWLDDEMSPSIRSSFWAATRRPILRGSAEDLSFHEPFSQRRPIRISATEREANCVQITSDYSDLWLCIVSSMAAQHVISFTITFFLHNLCGQRSGRAFFVFARFRLLSAFDRLCNKL